MKKLIIVLLLIPSLCVGQDFNRPAKESIKVSHPVFIQLKQYLEKYKGLPVMPEMFIHLPAYNILNRSERAFVDGIYFFVESAHDSGTLFINRKGKATILPSDTPTDAIAAYSAFLKKNNLPESTQITYMGAIAAFLKYRHQNQIELVKSGGLIELK